MLYHIRHRPLRGGLRLLLSAIAFLLLSVLVAGSRVVSAEEVIEVDIPGVTRLEVRGGSQVELSQGEPGLWVRGSRKDLDKVPYMANAGGLVLGYSRKHRRESFPDVKFRVTLPDIEEIEIKGSGVIYVRSFDVQDLQVNLKGSGDARLHDLRGENLGLRVSGSGDIQVVKAEVRSLQAVLAGSGDIDIGTLAADSAEIVVQGSGDMRVQSASLLEDLALSIVGSGGVDLAGMPARDAKVNIVGSGDARLGELSGSLDVTVLGSGSVLYSGDVRERATILGSGRVKRRNE